MADYLMKGSDYDVVSAWFTDYELISQFKEVEKLD